MIALALDVLAFLFLAAVALIALGTLVLVPRRVWKRAGIVAGTLALPVLYIAAPGFLAGLVGLAGMFGLAVLICLGLDRLWTRLQ